MADICFIKEKKERNFTVLDNTFIRDSRLSWKARGIMAYLLALPDDWKIYMSELTDHAPDGITALKSAIKELKQFGYLSFSRTRNDKGAFEDGVWRIIENPQVENPHVDYPRVDNQQLPNTNNIQNTNNIPNTTPNESVLLTERYKETYKRVMNRDYKIANYSMHYGFCKKLLSKYGIDTLLEVLDKAPSVPFCVNQLAFQFNKIFSEKMIESILNYVPAKFQKDSFQAQSDNDFSREVDF